MLLIPRQHVKNILALTDETNKNFSDFFLVVKKIAEQEGLGDNGFRLVINTGAEAGQTVFHFLSLIHISIIFPSLPDWIITPSTDLSWGNMATAR